MIIRYYDPYYYVLYYCSYVIENPLLNALPTFYYISPSLPCQSYVVVFVIRIVLILRTKSCSDYAKPQHALEEKEREMADFGTMTHVIH